jgi:hypothetical protein
MLFRITSRNGSLSLRAKRSATSCTSAGLRRDGMQVTQVGAGYGFHS